MNVTLRGRAKQILEFMVSEGYANTLSEAIRLSIINFGDSHLTERELVNKKLNLIDEAITKGHRKVLSAEEAMGAYAKKLK